VATPSRFKLRGIRTKAVLREALAGLVPPAILSRRKMGFPVPLARWLRGPFLPLVRELLLSPRSADRRLFDPPAVARIVEEHRSGVRDHAHRLWLLLGLELWMRIFVDRETETEVAAACAS
jgi:asparagine synthase (glutamine-hydrolysing)